MERKNSSIYRVITSSTGRACLLVAQLIINQISPIHSITSSKCGEPRASSWTCFWGLVLLGFGFLFGFWGRGELMKKQDVSNFKKHWQKLSISDYLKIASILLLQIAKMGQQGTGVQLKKQQTFFTGQQKQKLVSTLAPKSRRVQTLAQLWLNPAGLS